MEGGRENGRNYENVCIMLEIFYRLIDIIKIYIVELLFLNKVYIICIKVLIF